MKVGLGIPFWGDDPDRLRAYHKVRWELQDMFPWDIEVIHPGQQTRGSARNAIVSALEVLECDVAVICDADTLPEKEALRDAIYGAHTVGGQHFPYNSYHYLSEEGTKLFYRGVREFDYSHYDMEGPGSYGGVFAIRPDDWWAAGGSPDLVGWGFEDIIFVVQARTLVGEAKWHPGALTHLWHPSAVSTTSESYVRNLAICQKFESVDRNPEALKALMLMGIGNHAPIGLGRVFPGYS